MITSIIFPNNLREFISSGKLLVTTLSLTDELNDDWLLLTNRTIYHTYLLDFCKQNLTNKYIIDICKKNVLPQYKKTLTQMGE